MHFTHRSSPNTPPLALFVAGNRDALALVYILPGAEFQSLTFRTFVMMYMDHVLYSPGLATSMRQGQTNVKVKTGWVKMSKVVILGKHMWWVYTGGSQYILIKHSAGQEEETAILVPES